MNSRNTAAPASPKDAKPANNETSESFAARMIAAAKKLKDAILPRPKRKPPKIEYTP